MRGCVAVGDGLIQFVPFAVFAHLADCFGSDTPPLLLGQAKAAAVEPHAAQRECDAVLKEFTLGEGHAAAYPKRRTAVRSDG
jgi:hypothetical protein